MNYLAFQQFEPHEQKNTFNCIWCGKTIPKNRAHIISRKLTSKAGNNPTLSFSVCTSCNSKCGKLEEWILRYTPISWIRYMLYLHLGSEGTTQYIPSYFFSAVLKDWIVFYLNSKTKSYAISTQLIIFSNLKTTLLTEEPFEKHEDILSSIRNAVRDNLFKIDIRTSLPEDFSPRLLFENGNVILISQSKIELELLIDYIPDSIEKALPVKRIQLENTSKERHHFRWSKVNWIRFCAKISLEILCLVEGGDKCLHPAFRFVRDFVLNSVQKKGREIVFNEKGPLNVDDVPQSVFVDLSPAQNAPQPITAFLSHCEPGMHIVTLYEICGWIISSVSIAGFPPSVLVLGGPNEHLADIYQIIYDDQEANFYFLRLAHDKLKPVIPISIDGDCFSELAKTYRLVGM